MGSCKQGRPWATGIGFAVFLAFSFQAVNATIITTGCADANACTLQELVDGGSIQVNDVAFDTWSVLDASSNPVDLSSVNVVVLDDQPSNVGLAFAANGAMSTVGFDLIDLSINFAATALPGAQRITGISFELTDFSFGGDNAGGFIEGFEDALDPSSGPIGGVFVEADNQAPAIFQLSDSSAFAPTSTVAIEKLILMGGDGDNDTVALDRFEQRFQLAQVPATVPLLLMFSGLISLAWSRRTGGIPSKNLC